MERAEGHGERQRCGLRHSRKGMLHSRHVEQPGGAESRAPQKLRDVREVPGSGHGGPYWETWQSQIRFQDRRFCSRAGEETARDGIPRRASAGVHEPDGCSNQHGQDVARASPGQLAEGSRGLSPLAGWQGLGPVGLAEAQRKCLQGYAAQLLRVEEALRASEEHHGGL